MTTTPPPAKGARIPWTGLPASLRARIDERLGAPVRTATTQPGGFCARASRPAWCWPTVAARSSRRPTRMATRSPRISTDARARSWRPCRRRRRCRGCSGCSTTDPASGSSLAFEDIEGRMPAVPWRPATWRGPGARSTALAARSTPSPLGRDLVGDAADCSSRAADGWASIVDGGAGRARRWSRRHLDGLARLAAAAPEAVRHDPGPLRYPRPTTLLLTADGVRVVDWPHARIGQPWVDLVWFAPSVGMQGGPDPGACSRATRRPAGPIPRPSTRRSPALAAYFTIDALRPATARPADAAPVPGRPGRGRPPLARRPTRLALRRPLTELHLF